MALVKTVIFDLDGTLCDKKISLEGGISNVCELLNRAHGIDSNIIKKKLSMLIEENADLNIKNIFKLLLQELDIDADSKLIHEMVDIFYSYTPESLKPYSNVKEMIELLKIRGYKLILLSDGKSNVQRHKLNLMGLSKYFDWIFISEDYTTEYERIHPLLFSLAISKSHLTPEEIAYVSANPIEQHFASAKEMGINTIRFLNNKDPSFEPEVMHADTVIMEIEELPKAIAEFQTSSFTDYPVVIALASIIFIIIPLIVMSSYNDLMYLDLVSIVYLWKILGLGSMYYVGYNSIIMKHADAFFMIKFNAFCSSFMYSTMFFILMLITPFIKISKKLIISILMIVIIYVLCVLRDLILIYCAYVLNIALLKSHISVIAIITGIAIVLLIYIITTNSIQEYQHQVR